MNLPTARASDLIEQEAGSELLVYDLRINKAYNLNATSKLVFKACGNNETFEDLKSKHNFTDDLIYLSLDELRKNNLLASDYDSPFANMNRREVVKKIGLSSMLALPVIMILVAPSAINAASGTCAGTCYAPSQNICAGRAGQTINFTFYPSSNGSCTGNGGSVSNIQCPTNGASVTGNPDTCVV